MKKYVVFSLFLLVLIIVFAYGVFSGLTGQTYSFDYYYNDNNRQLDQDNDKVASLKYKYKEFLNLSGNKTTINGFPMEVWLAENIDKSHNVAKYFLSNWQKKGFLFSSAESKDGDFVASFDHKKQKFYGSISSGKYKKGSVSIPFSVDMKKENIKDIWDDDFPEKIIRKKSFHLRTVLGNKIFEKCYFVDDKPIFNNITSLKSQFKNKGWVVKDSEVDSANSQNETIIFCSKNNKNCIISVAKSKADIKKTVIAIILGNNI